VEISVPLILDIIQPSEPFELAKPQEASKKLITDLTRMLKEIERLNAEVKDALDDDDIQIKGTKTYNQILDLNLSLTGIREEMEKSLDTAASKFNFEQRFTNALERALAVFDAEDESADASLDIQAAVAKAIEYVLTFKLAIWRKAVRKHSPAGLSSSTLLVLYGKKEAEPLNLLDEDDDDESHVETLYSQLLDAIPDFLKAMKERAKVRAFSKFAKNPEIEVAAHSVEVKNQGTPGTITRLNIAMSEEGLEWVAESNDKGGQDWKLMQE
jgi:hypothetical protein